MNYKEYGYKEFLDKVSDGTYVVTELELREQQDISSTRVIMRTDATNKPNYPIEILRYYEICVEYVKRHDLAKGRTIYYSDCIAFSAPGKELYTEMDSFTKAKEIFEELRTKRYASKKNKFQ